MSLFSSHDQGELILILDVQSSIVRGSVVSLAKGNAPNVIFTYNAHIPWKPHTDSNFLIKVTLKAVSETVDACVRSVHMQKSSHGSLHISDVHFALSSPWIVSEAKTLSSQFPKDTLITKAYVEKINESERSKLASQDQSDISIIEQKIFDVRLNGYSVDTWMGKSARTIDVSYTMSLAGTRMIERFKDAVMHISKHGSIYFHSSLLLQFIGMRICMAEWGTYALIHVHGELTDVAIMDHHACVFFGSYQFGVRTLARKIAAATGTDEQAADSLLALFVGGHVDGTHGKDQSQIVQSIREEWASELKKVLPSEPNTVLMPAHIVISATAHDDFFVDGLKTVYARSAVETLSIEHVLPHVTFNEQAERRRLTGLYAVALSSML